MCDRAAVEAEAFLRLFEISTHNVDEVVNLHPDVTADIVPEEAQRRSKVRQSSAGGLEQFDGRPKPCDPQGLDLDPGGPRRQDVEQPRPLEPMVLW